MIYICPFCGKNVSRAINDGITTCNNCSRVFDSTPYHRILAASWAVRLYKINDAELLQSSYELTDCEVGIVKKYVINDNYSHDDLLKVVDKKICLDHN